MIPAQTHKNQLVTLKQGGKSSLAIFAYLSPGTPQDRWTERAWYGGAVWALTVVWSQSETNLENRTVLILLSPPSPAQSVGFHMSKPGKSRWQSCQHENKQTNKREPGGRTGQEVQEEEAIAAFHYLKEGYRQDSVNPHEQCTPKWQLTVCDHYPKGNSTWT